MMRARQALALLLALSLAACALPAGRTGAGAVSMMVFGDPAELQAYADLVAAFEQRYPQVDVELITVPAQGDYRKRMAADLAAGAPADVLLINYRAVPLYAARGALEPLGGYLDASALLRPADFYPQALEAFRWQGAQQCIPQNISSLAVYYNATLFAEAGLPAPRAGWSWAEFLAAAQALTRDRDGDGVTDQYGFGTEVETIRLAPFIWQSGGDLVDDPERPSRLAIGTPQARAALQWFTDLQVRYHVAPDAAQEQAEDSQSRFERGQLGMLLQSRRVVPTFRRISGFTWDVAPLPQGAAAATILHADGYCMPSASRNKAAAWQLIEFANSPEGQTIVARTGRTVPSLRAVAESPAFLDPQVAPRSSHVFLDVIPSIRPAPASPRWIEIEDALTAEIQRAYYGRASVEEAIAAALAATTPMFRDD